MQDSLPPTVEGPRPPHPSGAQGGSRDGVTAGPCRGPRQPLGEVALPRLLARSAAGAAAGCATVHGLLLAAGPWSWPAAGTAALAAACLLCAAHLWRDGGLTTWVVHAGLSVLMLSVHPAAGGHHGGGGLAAWAGPGAGMLAAVALSLALVRAACALRRGQVPGSAVSSGGRRVPQA